MDKIQRIKQIEKELKELKEQVKTESEDTILVPENIKLETGCGACDRLGLVFENKKQTLTYHNGVYNVDRTCEGDFVQCKLTPCKREDLKPGDTAFRTDSSTTNFTILYHYCKIISDTKYAYISGENTRVRSISFKYWYKVEKVD